MYRSPRPRPADLSAHLGQWARGLAAPEKLKSFVCLKPYSVGRPPPICFWARKSEAPAQGDFWIFCAKGQILTRLASVALFLLSEGLIMNLQLSVKALYFNNYDPGRIL